MGTDGSGLRDKFRELERGERRSRSAVADTSTKRSRVRVADDDML